MNKNAKGALAASAAAALLLGGAGTLAYWTDSATVNGGSANAGYLTLKAGTCDSAWTYANGSKSGTTVTTFVPGDQITKKCTFTIGAKGDNLQATPTVPSTVNINATPATGNPAAASFKATVAATYALPSGAVTGASKITEANDGQTLTATFKVTFPFGTNQSATPIVNGNDTQKVTATLDALTVSLTQDQAAGNPN